MCHHVCKSKIFSGVRAFHVHVAAALVWFPPQNINAAVAVCEEEHVVVVVPGDLVHLELELLLCPGPMRLGVDEGHHIVFVPDSDGLTVGAPADVDVLT